MRYKIFMDTNILISGIFFEGNKSKILEMTELELICSEDTVDELKKIVKKKIRYLGDRTLEIALLEIDRALYDIEVLSREKYKKFFSEAKKLIKHQKDVPILSAAIYAKADYLITGDNHFFNDEIISRFNVRTAREFLDEIEKTS